MAQWVDIKKVRESVSIEQILEYYGLEENLIRKGDQLIGPCPIHKGTNKSQFHVSLTKNAFRCFGDCSSDPRLHSGGGNALSLVIVLEDINESDDPDQRKAARKAALLLQEWFSLSSPRTPRQQSKTAVREAKTHPGPQHIDSVTNLDTPEVHEPEKPLANAPLPFAFKHLDTAHPYLTERGFTPETMAHFSAGYHNGKGIMHGRVVIPIHQADGTLVGYAGRWPGNEPPDGEGKYKLPQGFHKALELFNIHRAKECAREHGLVLVEGYFDVLRLYQLGICHAVALMGSSLSEAQQALILEAVGSHGRLTLLFDGDTSGRTITEDALVRLSRNAHVRAMYLPDGVQPDQLTKEELVNLSLS